MANICFTHVKSFILEYHISNYYQPVEIELNHYSERTHQFYWGFSPTFIHSILFYRNTLGRHRLRALVKANSAFSPSKQGKSSKWK